MQNTADLVGGLGGGRIKIKTGINHLYGKIQYVHY